MKQSKKPSESEWDAVKTGLLVEIIHINMENKLNNKWKTYKTTTNLRGMVYFLNRITNREILIYNTHLFNIFKNLKFTNDVCMRYWRFCHPNILQLLEATENSCITPDELQRSPSTKTRLQVILIVWSRLAARMESSLRKIVY